MNTSVVQAAAITALVEATAGIILFITPTNTWHICAYSSIARLMKIFRLTPKTAYGSSTIHPLRRTYITGSWHFSSRTPTVSCGGLGIDSLHH